MGLYNNIALFFSFKDFSNITMEVNCVAEVVGLKEEKNYTDKYIVKIIKCDTSQNINNKKFIAYIEKDKNYKAGDIVVLNGTIESPEEASNFYGFNYRNFLKQKKIYGILRVEKSNYIENKKDFYYILGKVQFSLKDKTQNLYDKNYVDVINKILFGISGSIDEDINENFRDAGISHVLAISGLHITYVIMIISFALEKSIYDIKLKNFLICIILLLFLIITGMSPSCIRSCIMSILNLIAKNIYRKSNIYVNITFSFLILISFNMYVIYNVGMWFSFFGTLGIVLFYSFLKSLFKVNKNMLIHKIINIILVSISAQILIWPISLYYFNTISFTFFISNLFISVLIGPIIFLGYFSIIISYFIPTFAKSIVFLEEILIKALFLIAKICSKIPFSKIYIKGTNECFLFVYYGLICIVLYCYYKYKLSFLRKIIYIKKLNIRKIIGQKLLEKFLKSNKKTIKTIIIIILIVNILSSHIKLKNDDFKLYFIDVGQGDCTLIQEDGKNIIIDGGEGNSESYDYGKNVIFQHLLKLGITKIDYMFFSHMDSDHAGGLMYILENMKVEEVLIGIQPETSYQLETLLEIVKNKKIKLKVLESTNKIKISKRCYIDVLWPIKSGLITENALNNNSLVFKLYYKEISILFTGDIEEIAEKQLVEIYKEKLKCDILKVAHHGSKTSSIQEFINYTSPKIALIGVGKNNKFGHPNSYVIKKLNEKNCKIYRTDLLGEIIIKINKLKKVKINTKL